MSVKPILLICAVLMSLCTSAMAQSLIYCSEGSPDGFDPALHSSRTTFDASSYPIYDRLVGFKTGTTEIIPALAESWDISDDARSFTFNLRQGVAFHANEHFTPTRDFNADDVIFSFERQFKPDNPYHQVSGGTWRYFNGLSLTRLIDSIEKIDDYTVTFNLTQPEAPFIAQIAMDFASILSKEYADSMHEAGTPELLNEAPVGTGPFVFDSYQRHTVIRYVRHENYWGEPAKVERLLFVITPDPSARYLKLQAGVCHIMAYPNPADIRAMRNAENIIVTRQSDLNIGFLAYNTQMPPYDNVTVRKALNMAINKQNIVDVLFDGSAQVAKNPIPPNAWSYDTTPSDDIYDPETARTLLVGEGVSDLKLRLWAMPEPRRYMPNGLEMAALIKDDLSKIGVEVEIVTYEWEEFLQRSTNIDRRGAMLLGWTGDNGDPDNFLAPLLSCEAVEATNIAQWCDAEFDEIIREARSIPSAEARGALYQQAQAIFRREAPWAPLVHSSSFVAMSANVENYVMDPLGGHNFNQVGIAE